MNKADFLNIIGDTSRIDRQMLGEIQELVEIFPYFQGAHLLLLKGLQNNGDVKFETQLRSSAIHIADREVLYYLLNSPLNSSILQTDTVSETAVSKQEAVPEAQEGAVNDLTEESMQPSGSGARQEEPEIIPEGIKGNHDNLFLDEPVIPMEPDFETASVNSEENFTGVPLSGVSANPADAGEETTPELLELDISEDEEYGQESTGSGDSEYIKKKLQAELIDRFIIANPRIEPNREKAAVQQEDISKPYTEENGGFITETLARIYVSQGYYSKAIDIYEKLSLKFPEKSSYFATQIEKVKEHLKN